MYGFVVSSKVPVQRSFQKTMVVTGCLGHSSGVAQVGGCHDAHLMWGKKSETAQNWQLVFFIGRLPDALIDTVDAAFIARRMVAGIARPCFNGPGAIPASTLGVLGTVEEREVPGLLVVDIANSDAAAVAGHL